MCKARRQSEKEVIRFRDIIRRYLFIFAKTTIDAMARAKWVVVHETGGGAAPSETDAMLFEDGNKAIKEFDTQSENAMRGRAWGRVDTVILAQVIEAYEIREKDIRTLH